MATKKKYRVTGEPDVGFILDGVPVMGGDELELSDEDAAYRLKLKTIEGPLDDEGNPPETEQAEGQDGKPKSAKPKPKRPGR